MGTKLELGAVTAGYMSASRLQVIIDAIEAELDLCLYRDGSSPNPMLADLDMNSNDILNAGVVYADDIEVDGTSIIEQVETAAASAVAAAVSEAAAAASAAAAQAISDAISGLDSFLALSDTPGTYAGSANKFVVVNAGATGLEFGVAAGSEPSNGDKGDITVSGSGLTWTIEDGVAVSGWNLTSPTITTSVIFDGVTVTGLTGADVNIVTGTAGAANALAMWNADGDVITSGFGTIDEDSMATDSAVLLPSQQSVKAYVDAQVATVATTAGQIVVATSATSASVGTLAADNTIPQNTEGTEVVTATITPVNAGSTILIECVFTGSNTNNGTVMTGAIFVDSTADAIGANSFEVDSGAALDTIPVVATHAPGDTSAHTYKLRVGKSAGTGYVNRTSTGDIFSTAGPLAMIKLTEILP